MSKNNVMQVHIDDGNYVLSVAGHEISRTAIESITLRSGSNQFCAASIDLLVEPMPDNSHIIPDAENKKPLYDDDEKKVITESILRMAGVNSDKLEDALDGIVKLWTR